MIRYGACWKLVRGTWVHANKSYTSQLVQRSAPGPQRWDAWREMHMQIVETRQSGENPPHRVPQRSGANPTRTSDNDLDQSLLLHLPKKGQALRIPSLSEASLEYREILPDSAAVSPFRLL